MRADTQELRVVGRTTFNHGSEMKRHLLHGLLSLGLGFGLMACGTEIGNCDVGSGSKTIDGNFIGNCTVGDGGQIIVEGNATVTGNLIGDPGGTITVREDSTITGNVNCDECKKLTMEDARVTGNVVSVDTPNVIVLRTNITGNLRVEGATNCAIETSQIGTTNAEGCTVM